LFKGILEKSCERILRMKNNIFELLQESKYSDFGDGVSATWIELAERELNLKFSPSYRNFLEKFGFGELGGVEVFGIYQLPFDKIVGGGDIVSKNIIYRKNNQKNSDRLYVSDDNGEELFYFDLSRVLPCGEYAIRRIDRIAGTDEVYAEDFFKFLLKRLEFFESAE